MLKIIRRYRSWGAAAVLSLAACHGFQTATDQNVAAMEEGRVGANTHWRNMADNALLQDMCVSDVHFVPHTSELSGTGTVRLERMSHLLDVYGGVVRYDTTLTDEGLVKQRMEHIREYIALCGCNMDRVQIKAMLAGGRGIEADQAIRVRERAAQPQTGAASGGAGTGAAGPGSGKSSGQGTGQ